MSAPGEGPPADESWPAAIPRVATGIVKVEHRQDHRPFQSYRLPNWVRHPDKQKPCMYLQPEDYMGSRKRHNDFSWNVAHVGAQCGMFEGQGFKMLEKATPDELNARDALEGWTPLHWAVLSDNPKAVIWLIKHGADKDIEDNKGRKAEDLIEDHWGEMHQRYWEAGPKKDGLPQPERIMPRRIKQMKDAFNLTYSDDMFDIPGYKAIEV